jgi:hypothetical protein
MADCPELFECVLGKRLEISPCRIGEVILEDGDMGSIFLKVLSGREGRGGGERFTDSFYGVIEGIESLKGKYFLAEGEGEVEAGFLNEGGAQVSEVVHGTVRGDGSLLQIALFLLVIHPHALPLTMTEIPQAVAVPHPAHSPQSNTNGITNTEAGDVPLELLERELPVVYDDQIYLRELLQRVVQTIYAELSEMAETYDFWA